MVPAFYPYARFQATGGLAHRLRLHADGESIEPILIDPRNVDVWMQG
jgi:hypothetical protein